MIILLVDIDFNTTTEKSDKKNRMQRIPHIRPGVVRKKALTLLKISSLIASMQEELRKGTHFLNHLVTL